MHTIEDTYLFRLLGGPLDGKTISSQFNKMSVDTRRNELHFAFAGAGRYYFQPGVMANHGREIVLLHRRRTWAEWYCDLKKSGRCTVEVADAKDDGPQMTKEQAMSKIAGRSGWKPVTFGDEDDDIE